METGYLGDKVVKVIKVKVIKVIKLFAWSQESAFLKNDLCLYTFITVWMIV